MNPRENLLRAYRFQQPEWIPIIARDVKGHVAIDLDIDRQNVTVNGSPRDVDDHVRECVAKLGSREGGLSLCYQPWPPTPPANLDAVFAATEKYRTYWK